MSSRRPFGQQLAQLQTHSTLVAVSADAERLQGTPARDVLAELAGVVAALRQPQSALLAETVAAHPGQPTDAIADRLLVRIACGLLQVMPGRVSLEVDARLGFDAAAIMARAQRLHALVLDEGVPPERLMFSVAATWEGIQAAKALAHHGIECSLGQVHGLCQAIACAEAGVAQIAVCAGTAGTQAVADIWRYFKKFGIDTEVMACGLNDAAQALALAGCDRLALSPDLMDAIAGADAPVSRALDAEQARGCSAHAQTFNEPSFRFALNEDAAASERLAAGLRAGVAAARALDALIETHPA